MNSITAELNVDLQKAEEIVTEELKKVGFGVLTKIDVSKTLKEKIDVDFQPLIILGACNPKFAHRALSHDINLSLLLPCNVTLSTATGSDKIIVKSVDPRDLIEGDELSELAGEAFEKLSQALNNARNVANG